MADVIISQDKRFDVDSANAARAFLAREAPHWNSPDVQLVWDACALHSTIFIATFKETLCNASRPQSTTIELGSMEG